MRHVCSAADDDEPEGVLLEILNARAVSSKKNSQTTGGKRAPTEHGYFTPRGEEKDIDTSQASVSVVTRLLNPTGEDRDENQSARMRRLCSATDDDEPEAMVLEMLNVRSSGNKSNLPIYRPNADVDLELVVESSLVEWDDESLPGPHSVHAATDVHLDFVDRGKFLYRSPVGAKSMHNMKTGPAEPVQRTLLKSSSMYDAKATPPRPRRHDDVTEPCSPGLLPSATKGAYSFSEERGEEKYNSEEELLEPEMDQSREFADVNSLFSKIRHNRLGFVASELEKGCDPSIRVRNLSRLLA